MLARSEAELTLQGTHFINIRLKETFPLRMIDTIKGRLRPQEYKDMVQNILEELQPADDSSDEGSKVCESGYKPKLRHGL